MEQGNELQNVLKALSNAAKVAIQAQEIGQNYTDKYCKYKKRDIVSFKKHLSDNPKRGKIIGISFYEHSRIDGLARITVKVIKENGEFSKADQKFYYLDNPEQILTAPDSV